MTEKTNYMGFLNISYNERITKKDPKEEAWKSAFQRGGRRRKK